MSDGQLLMMMMMVVVVVVAAVTLVVTVIVMNITFENHRVFFAFARLFGRHD